MLWQDMMQECVTLTEVSQDDGEGGKTLSFASEAPFKAAFVPTMNTNATRQERDALSLSYTVTANVLLPFAKAFRDSEGKGYRVTSYAQKVPDPASFTFYQFTADRWEFADE